MNMDLPEKKVNKNFHKIVNKNFHEEEPAISEQPVHFCI